MKNLFANLVLFFVLSIVLSGFTACSNTANTQKGSVDKNVLPSNTTTESKKGVFPPAPVGFMQAEIKDLDGNTFKLEDKKSKVVLVNLWATWCGPCRSEMPELVAMQEKYKDFEVIGLNVDDESVGQIKEFAEKMNLNYQLGYADNKLMSEFIKISHRSEIPQSILVNREGELTGVFLGAGTGVVNKMKESVDKTVNE